MNRRGFLRDFGGLGLTVAAPSIADARQHDRAERAYRIRHDSALGQRRRASPEHPTNGDEQRFADRRACYTKGLPHDAFGRVSASAYSALLRALRSGRPADFDAVRLGRVKKLVNPQAALAFVLEGPDPHQLAIPAPPSYVSAETAAEMVELYWQALLRDVAFAEYDTHPGAQAAAAELSALAPFSGPRVGQVVTGGTLFRDNAVGALAGPYISQFLLKDVPFGATTMVQRIRTARPGVDYLFTPARWRAVQNGDVAGSNQLDPQLRYIRNGRDLAEYVHRDFSYQAFLFAGLFLLALNGVWDEGNPYFRSETQAGFATFGEPHVLDMVARVANAALKAAWFQKWLVHRRLRPEEFGGRVHLHALGFVREPIHDSLFQSRALERTRAAQASSLLTQAYPEGCPLHPAYPAGHAAVAGACVTALKAFFDETRVVPDPVTPAADGTSLQPHTGPPLTVGGELDKLASNIAFGRNFAGIHWRTDASAGLRLGEAVALGILTDSRACFNEGPPP